MSRYYMSTTVEVDVDITEDDLTNDDLLELCKERGITVNAEIIEEFYVLFKQGKHDAILERVRQVVQDAKGVVL